MIELHLKLFGLTIDLEIRVPSRKKPIDEIETPIDVNITPQKEINSFDEEEEEKINVIPTSIQSQASRFEEELKTLGIYDIPDTSDIPPTYEIQDDVEIITNEFEKEQQDMIENRRR